MCPRSKLSVAVLVLLACGVASEPAGVVPEPEAQTVPEPEAQTVPEPEAQTVWQGSDLIGRSAAALDVDGWLGDAPGPASIEALRGQVVLVRFWTDTCPFCKATAPALVELDRDFRDRGLVVLGLYHPKPRPRSDEAIDAEAMRARVARVADEYGFRFAIGLDLRWRTIDAWWLDSGERDATSATFVIDREGVIRGLHPGPEYHPGGPADHASCRTDYAELRALVDSLL